MKKLFLILCLMIAMPVSAQTVNRWQAEVSQACEMYVSTNYSPNDLFACLIETTENPYIWRKGWEQPVKANVLGILAAYDGAELKLSETEKAELAEQMRQTLPVMYRRKMLMRENRMQKFTQADIQRIWSAKVR